MLAVVDYEMGNLRSVAKAFERLGQAVEVTSDPQRLLAAEGIVLPGVGAFGDCMGNLERHGLVDPLRRLIAAGRPYLGICLGLQVLFEWSEESSNAAGRAGLGVLPGVVRRFPSGLKVPHMGWNQVRFTRTPPLFDGIADDSYFYFVHSYYAVPADDSVVAARTDYGEAFVSAVWRQRLFAVQFHPEKSQQLGLRVLENFAAFCRQAAATTRLHNRPGNGHSGEWRADVSRTSVSKDDGAQDADLPRH
ncbi:MAG: imidazole glycerol phosphate synthase subunit HisH [Candidatus Tectomicrobia bacterium]|nr:imidazole glycerol phosphate synthase subunit HisH [Candidatus Tectomicrobia bacterium]